MRPLPNLLSLGLTSLVLVSGCKKEPDVSQPAPLSSRETPAVLEPAQRTNDSPTVATNLQTAAAEPEPAPTPALLLEPAVSSTNAPASAPKPPGQDMFEQALAIVRTNLSSGAAEEAVILFRSAAEQGNVAAQYALGVAHLTGLGVQKDPAEAVKWLEMSANRGHPDALFKMASLYAQGSGVPQDEKKSAELALASAERGHAEAQYNVATLYASGRGVEKNMAEAAKWFQKAAQKGHPTAQSNLGVLYATGNGVERNPEEAQKWWQRAAERGQTSAQFNVAHLYREGRGVAKDPIEAYKWYYLAAQQGDKDAALARDILAVDLSPTEVAEGMKRAREFKATVYAKLQEIRSAQ
jgi:TPR repeat protein